MNLNCGIVGLPNVGKSTIFSSLSNTKAEIANYPFCTIDPNIGIVDVPDPRLDRICALIPAEKRVPATIQFVDIAGLVKGASKGEGLGNQFLSNVRETGLICHVVRCFEDKDVVHVDGKIDPASDIATINTELCLKDLDTVTKVLEKERKMSRGAKGNTLLDAYERLVAHLSDGKPARSFQLADKEREEIDKLQLLTMKNVIYVANCGEEDIAEGNQWTRTVDEIASSEGAESVRICGKIEAELSEINDPDEKKEMLAMYGLKESGLSALITKAFHLLGLRTFFTAGGVENKAWVFRKGMKAPECAGIIHTDFQKGFIKAEVYSFSDLDALGSEQEIRKKGLLRLEGKEYEMQDGDVVYFKFNT